MVGEVFTSSTPETWEPTTLGELVKRSGGTIQTGPFGSQLHASDYVPVGVPFVMPVNIGDNRIIEDGIARIGDADAQRLSRYQLQQGDIIYSRRGDVERRALVRSKEEGWICGSGCLMVRVGAETVEPIYASYYLGHPAVREWIVRHAVGATMPNLNTSIMEALPFLLPPLPEQRAIAHILGTLDDKIELNRRMNETLEATARAIFKSWFVDFDPVRAKMRGEQPAGLAPHIAALFPDALVETELGEAPEGWEVGTLNDCAFLNPESWTKQTRPETIKYVDLTNTKWGRIESVAEYLQKDAPSRAQRILRPKDTIIGTVRPGNGSYAYVLEMGLTGSTGFAVLRPHRNDLAEFVYLAATAPENIMALAHLADGAAYPAVRPEVVSAIQVAIPDANIMHVFSHTVQPMSMKVVQNERESGTLAALRDTLLPKLISGELRVAEAERIIGREI